jgi:protein-disulfide isomerase
MLNPRVTRTLFLALGICGLCVFAVYGAVVFAQQSKETPPPAGQSVTELMQWYQAQPRLTQPVFTTGAKVVVVKFTDVACPGCGLTHEAYKPVLAKYQAQFPGAVKYVTKDYPLNQECNPTLVRTLQGHEGSCEGAIALRLAAPKGRAGALEDFLYSNQRVLTPDVVQRAASFVGNVTPADFQAGRAASLDAIRADVALGQSIGVNSTPTFVVNGVKVPKVMEPSLFDAILTYELRRAGVMK